MSSYLKNDGNLLEPASGDGQLLKYINLDNYDKIDLYEINKDYLDKCPSKLNINKYKLDFLKKEFNEKYKNIIMNPPYIKIQDLSPDYRVFLKEKYSLLGAMDIYYAFIYKCIELLDDDGVLVMITPNSYLTNKSSTNLRQYLIDNKLIYKIIDYKSEKIFPNVSTYVCITIINKNNKDNLIYSKLNEGEDNIKYEDICKKTYNIFNEKIDESKIQLKEICTIRNGLATLKDDVYIHGEKLYDEPCWKTLSTGELNKYIIYPYNDDANIILEGDFKKINPETYKYLLTKKGELESREKGKAKKEYKIWYQYGRSQSLKVSKSDKVMYISSFCYPDNIIFNIKEPYLYAYCLQVDVFDKKYTLENIKDIIKNNKEYLINNCNKRAGGWINLQTSVLNRLVIN